LKKRPPLGNKDRQNKNSRKTGRAEGLAKAERHKKRKKICELRQSTRSIVFIGSRLALEFPPLYEILI